VSYWLAKAAPEMVSVPVILLPATVIPPAPKRFKFEAIGLIFPPVFPVMVLIDSKPKIPYCDIDIPPYISAP
jgi:hypothetical protein